jgi:hypothetical protein
VSGISLAAKVFPESRRSSPTKNAFTTALSRAWLVLSGGLSLACAVHCALVPLMFVLMPTLKMALYSVRDPQHHMAMFLLQSVRFEQPLVFAGLILTALTLIQARLRGKISADAQTSVWLLYGLGAGLTLAGAFSPMAATIQHAVFMVFGGTVLVCASILNARRETCLPCR